MSAEASQIQDFKNRLKEKEDVLDAAIASTDMQEAPDLKPFSEEVSALCKEINACSNEIRAEMQPIIQEFTQKLRVCAEKMQQMAEGSAESN